MEFEWDEAKRKRNLAKHAVDFDSIADFNWTDAIIYPDQRRDYGEDRFLAYGTIATRLYACTFTYRKNHTRIIGLRKANDREERMYEKAKQTTH